MSAKYGSRYNQVVNLHLLLLFLKVLVRHGKTQRKNQFLESLKAEDEMIVEDMQPSMLAQYTSTAQKLTDPVTLTAEKKLIVTLKRDAWWNE
ncbi:hypothetical protein NC651_002976 [Populus alba x Populus x berolinensis]|nr:hypothetical protein NC651_002976 [Populus alba x Populus x berolinensis]